MFVFTNFNTPDQAGLPGFETASSGGSTDGFDVVSNAAQTDVSSGTTGAAFYSTAPGSDQWAQVTLANNTGTSVGPTVRVTRLNTTTVSSTGYYARHNGSSVILLRLNSDGSTTQLGSSYSATRVAGDVLRLQVSGSNLSVYLNSVTTAIITATDTTFTNGTIGFRAGSGSGIRIEDFSGGDVTAYTYQSTVNNQSPNAYYTLEATSSIETMGSWTAKAGLFNNALWGSGDCRITDYTQPSATSELAWSGWINLSAVASGSNTQFVDSQVSGTGMFSLIMDNIDTYTGRMFVRNSNNVDYDITRNYKFDTWAHIAVTTNASGGDAGDVYLNGVKVVSNMSMGNFTKGTANRRIRWGGNLAGGTWKYDEMAVWRRSLTSSEVVAQYNAGPFTPVVTPVNAKVTAPVATASFAGTDGNIAYQYMDTTSVSGYRSMLLGQRTVQWYNDGLALTNLGQVGGSWSTSGNANVQQQGKFTGGVKLVGQMLDISSIYYTQTKSSTNGLTAVSFWFRAVGLTSNRVIFAQTVAGLNRNYIQANANGTITVNGTNFTGVTNLNNEKWHHVVYGVTSGSIALTVDGVNLGSTALVSIADGSTVNTQFQTSMGTTTYFDEMAIIQSGNVGWTTANVTQQYTYSEVRQKTDAGSFGLFGTTNNNANNATNVRQVGGGVTIGFNGTNNNTPRVNRRITTDAGNATFIGRNANVSSTRNFRFPVPAGSMNFTGTNGNRGYTPIANNKAEPAYMNLNGVAARVFTPVNVRVVAPATTMSVSGTSAVFKTRTDRTVPVTAGTTLMFAQGAKLKVNGEYVDNFNNFNRWYQQIRATHIAKNPTVVSEDYKLGTALQWYKFEGDQPPYLAAAGANGASTGTVEVVGDYQLGIDAGHTRNGIKLRNGGYFKSRVTYPFLIPGAQQQLLGGLRTHYTAEFAFRAYAPGAICNGVRINAGGKLEFLQSNGYWYELRTEYANLLDGQYHHVVFISPQQYFVPPESNPDRNFVVVDGRVVSAVHAPVYVPNTWGYDSVTGANAQIDFDDIIIDMFRIISTAEASKLYYEYSEAVIVNAGSPARFVLAGTANNKPKGNVLRVLALYGSPAGYRTTGEETFKYMNEYSSFKISNGSESQVSPTGFQNDGGRGDTFRYNGMLVFPVSYTAKNASAAGVLDTNRATYIDDKTGYTRLIDFDNDFAVDPADFDIVTVVRWPSMQDSLVTRPFLTYAPGTGGSYFGNQAPASEPNDIVLARRNTIEKFAQGILKLANKGVHVWVQDPATALGLGLITGFLDDQPRLTERTEDDGTLNLGARNTDIAYGKTPPVGTLGSPGYADTGHNIWKRRITAVLPGLTDVPSWATIDAVEWRDLNPFAAHAVQYRRKYLYSTNVGLGYEFAVVSDGNTGTEYYYTKGFVSADPTGYIGTPVSRGQNVVSTKAGTFVDNPYKDRIQTLAVEAGTTIKGIKINARIFAEFNEKLSQPYVLMGNDKNYINGRPLLPNEQPNQWDYDSTRENQIVANYALERFRNNLYIGAEAQPYIVYGNGVPTQLYGAIDMHTRGINWLKSYVAPNGGDAKVQAPAAVAVLQGGQANGKAVRNARVTSAPARARFEFTMPRNFQQTNARVTGFPATVAFRGVDLQSIVKTSVATIVISAANTKTTGEGQDLVLYYSNWAPALYKEDI